jgi:hypothetical protein
MPKRKKESKWRDKIYAEHGATVTLEIKQRVAGSPFTIKLHLMDDGAIPSLAHCKKSTRQLYLNAIISALQHAGKIKRRGKSYYFAKRVIKTKT